MDVREITKRQAQDLLVAFVRKHGEISRSQLMNFGGPIAVDAFYREILADNSRLDQLENDQIIIRAGY